MLSDVPPPPPPPTPRRVISLPPGHGSTGGTRHTGSTGRTGGGLRTAAPQVRPRPDTLEVIHSPDVPPPSTAPEELRELLRELRAERKRRRSVRHAKLLTGVVAIGLLGAWLLYPSDPAGYENRRLAAFPSFGPGNVSDATAFRDVDAALRDRLGMRQHVVRAIGDAAKNKLNVSLSPQVVLGDGGTPFTAEDFTLPCDSAFDPGQVRSGLAALDTVGAAHDRSIMVAVTPDKSSILTGQLGGLGQYLMSCSDQVRTRTRATFPEDGTGPVLTMWDRMAAVERSDPGQVYQHGDTHWTSRGALVFSQALLARLAAAGDAPRDLAGQPKGTRAPDQYDDADLYRMMGTPRQERVPVWLVNRPEVKVKAKVVRTASGRGMPVYRSTAKDPDDDVPLVPGRTLVVHDSFFARAEGQLAPFFEQLTVLHWADFLTDVQSGRLPAFDRVIIETVQRGWPQRAAWFQPGQPVYQALADGLAGRPGVPHGNQLATGARRGSTSSATTPP
jgi:hypothetical protein